MFFRRYKFLLLKQTWAGQSCVQFHIPSHFCCKNIWQKNLAYMNMKYSELQEYIRNYNISDPSNISVLLNSKVRHMRQAAIFNLITLKGILHSRYRQNVHFCVFGVNFLVIVFPIRT